MLEQRYIFHFPLLMYPFFLYKYTLSPYPFASIHFSLNLSYLFLFSKLMVMELVEETCIEEKSLENISTMKGVRHLCESGITKVPKRYIFPLHDRPIVLQQGDKKLPVIDLALLQAPQSHFQMLESLKNACENHGFFRVVNHGVESEVIRRMIDVGKRFFELPFEERMRYMSTDIRSPVRCGTSFNQNKDGVFCWRDFLKLNCFPLSTHLPHWPSSPLDLREGASEYAKQTNTLFLILMEAILKSMQLDTSVMREFREGTQMMVVNCYPSCPEPDLTLGMPPHSDYGFLTLLLQDDVEGLQVQHKGEWLTIEPIPNSFIVNVGDHLEIYSNGRYKSVLHRVLVNSTRSRISIASLHSLPFERIIGPSPELITRETPRLYKDTDFTAFLDYMAISDPTNKTFIASRKLNLANN
ncbi:Flavanone 3-dioxygenase protein [Dioscorea alata]|uniref:Flavanone 3-dioxygenase protein n=1 Tax=Dioscorea alata TaxID=55571 RepID=A0ACB7WSZ9_DIOAL|nr:Flavanone 3-dioxygenase protein [Dioscorea alata]